MIDPNFLIKAEVEKPGYGMFVIEPLEQGYGQTLGNSLRRVLLSSLPGSSIVSAKIEGVKHQFSTLSGMKEDVVEFLMNLKKVRLMNENSDPVTLTISKKGSGEVTAGDIEVSAGVTVVNPDLVLAHLSDKKSALEVTMTVEKGTGYVSADERHFDEVGVMSVDAMFSPITRVNYRVDATRVGRMTNLDRLVIEIWTDGSMSALEALKSGATILVTYFTQMVEQKKGSIAEKPSEIPAISDEVMKMRIEELDIPTRIVNALANGGVETIGQMVAISRADLMKIKNLGAKSLSVVEEKLREKGVTISA